jgi:hypothetical protein
METVPTAGFKALTGFDLWRVDGRKFKPPVRRVALNTPITGELKIVTYCLIEFPDKNQASIDKGINGPECGGDGKAGTTFHAFPVIVRQNRTGRKKRLESRLTGMI